MPTRVLLADDHQLVRESVRALLEKHGIEVLADVGDGREALALAERLRPDVAVLDLAMPHLNGLDCARQMRRASPSTKIVLLTMHREGQYLTEALRAGVSGFLLKTQLAQDLVRAIAEVQRGGICLSPLLSQALVDASLGKAPPSVELLTPREREVLQLVCEGSTSKEVAATLGVSVRTAESHRARIMQKLDIHEIAGLVRYAIRHGLVEP
jgi:DNA-binding NarL/FixJ family response regulator